MYLRRGGINTVNIGHEGMHGMLNMLSTLTAKPYYGEHSMTPLGVDLWDAAFVCAGQRPPAGNHPAH